MHIWCYDTGPGESMELGLVILVCCLDPFSIGKIIKHWNCLKKRKTMDINVSVIYKSFATSFPSSLPSFFFLSGLECSLSLSLSFFLPLSLSLSFFLPLSLSLPSFLLVSLSTFNDVLKGCVHVKPQDTKTNPWEEAKVS